MARRTEYVYADGSRTTDRTGAQLVGAAEVAEMARRYSSIVRPQYFVGTADGETGFCVNEEDTEESGFVSTGIFQQSVTEKVSALLPLANLLTLEDSTQVFASISEVRLRAIAAAAGFSVDAVPDDAWAYLGIAHNMGLGAALKSIRAYGLDWSAFKARNQGLRIVSSGYGDKCISGGTSWQPEYAQPSAVAGDESDGTDAPPAGQGSTGFGMRLVVFLIVVGLLYRVV